MAAINSINNEEIRLRALETAKLRAAQAKGVEGTPAPSVSAAPVGTPGVGSGELVTPQNYQLKVAEIARKNGEATKGVNPAISAAAGSVSAPVVQQPVSQPQVSKVDSNTAINHINGSTKTEISSALRGIGASAAYAKTANANSGNDAFASLKNVKINETTIAKSTTNPFANLANNNGSNYTQGLSFAGINNLDNLKYMEIA